MAGRHEPLEQVMRGKLLGAMGALADRHEASVAAMQKAVGNLGLGAASLPSDAVTKKCMDDLVSGGTITDISSPVIDDLKSRLKVVEVCMGVLFEAIDLNHVGHPPEGRSDDCWSCKIRETIKGLDVARKLMEAK